MNGKFRPLVPLASCLALSLTFSPKLSGAAYHGAFVIQNPLGPMGVPVAHVGDTVTSTIRMESMDGFGDSLTITNIMHTLGPAPGKPVALLSSPMVLSSFYQIADLTFTFVVPPTDQDFLVDLARAEGRDNYDGVQGSGVAEGFAHTVPGIVKILRPCLRFEGGSDTQGDQSGDAGGDGDSQGQGNGSSSGSDKTLRNCGNCPLRHIVVSNLIGGVFSYVLGPTNLEPGQTLQFTDAPPAVPHATGPNRIFAWAKDEADLLVAVSVHLGLLANDASQAGDALDNVLTLTPFLQAPVPEFLLPVYHGTFAYSSALGPEGTSITHIGDQLNVVIGIMNLDDFGGTITITNLTQTALHGTGAIKSGNLLSHPVTLDSYLVVGGACFLEITTGIPVAVGDGPYLLDYATLQGTINFDNPDGFKVPGGFESTVGTQARVLPPVHPSVQMVLNADAIAGTPAVLSLRWDSLAGTNYQVQYTTDLNQMNWTNLGGPIQATNSAITTSDAAGPDPRRFYRIIQVP